jgi:hypothetical protein
MLIDTAHTALEDAESAFNGVRRHITAHIFIALMVDG